MKLKQAKEIVIKICQDLEPWTKKINIAGSVKRQCEEVGDLEIVAVFNVKDLPKVKKYLESIGLIEKGKIDGRYIKVSLNTGIKLDLFIPQLEDYYRIYAIRVGSADYSAREIASGWRKQGWVGTEDGLRREEDCELKGKVWKVVNKMGEKPPVFESEADFFKFIKVQYKNPKDRK